MQPQTSLSLLKRLARRNPASCIRALDEKWSQRFARLEAILLAKTFTVPVSQVKQQTTVVTSERPFIPPRHPATDSSMLQSSGLVTQVSRSHAQLFAGTSDPILQFS